MRRLALILACAAPLLAAAALARKPPPLGQDGADTKPPPLQQPDARAPGGTEAAAALRGYKAVLVAGDASLPVFDNAVASVANRLRERGIPPGDIQRFSASRRTVAGGGARPASLARVLGAVAAMAPGAGQGCLVFATSHGARGYGLVLAATQEVLDPAALDQALTQGCGDSPTVVIISACFSGLYARSPVARPNRIVLTAARPDRTSFGCGAGYTYTVYDRCLLDAVGGDGGTWRGVFTAVRSCVAAEERRGDFIPSEPQAVFGADIGDLALPGIPAP